MEKLVEVAEQEVLVDFQLGVKCRATVHLRSLHPTAAVAFKVQTSSPHKFLVNPPGGLLPPLASASFQVILKPQSQLPHPFPRSPSDRFLIKAAPADDGFPDHRPNAVTSWFSSRPHAAATQDTKLRVVYAGPFLLRHVVSEGDVDAVRYILRRQKSLVSRLGPGDSAALLRSASTCLDPTVLNLLVDAGLMPPVTPPTAAAKARDAAAALPTAPKGWTPIHTAAASGGYDALVRLIEGAAAAAGGELDRGDADGRTALHLAASKGYIRCVRALVDGGADRNARSNDGRTALHRAAANGDHEMVALLLDMGADPTILTARGRSPLDVARDKGHHEVVEILERGELVLTAARRGELRRLESLLRKGVGAGSRDQYGMTALHSAAVKGHRDVVRLLAEFGAELEARDVEGHTPLHLAVEGGCLDTVGALVEMGADVNAQSKRGATPLYMAKSMGYEAISQLLLARGASPSCVASSSSSGLSSTSHG